MDRPWLDGVPAYEWRAAAAGERGTTTARTTNGYRARADRPRQRRSGEDDRGPARVASRIRNLQLRASDDGGSMAFTGYASVTDTPYEMWDMFGPYTEQVMGGAFGQTLARADLDVPLVLQHADLRRIARTTNGSLKLTEDDGGLLVDAPELDAKDSDVAYIVPKLRSGLVDEMSFKFMITSGSWSPDWMEYHINEVDIHRGDVAIVGYGANPHTAGAGLRGAFDPDAYLRGLTEDQRRSLAARLTPAAATRSLITDDDVRIRTL